MEMAATLMHVFQEDDERRRDLHMEFWFGFPREDGPDELGIRPACFCGGRIYRLQQGVGVIWHVREWRGKS